MAEQKYISILLESSCNVSSWPSSSTVIKPRVRMTTMDGTCHTRIDMWSWLELATGEVFSL